MLSFLDTEKEIDLALNSLCRESFDRGEEIGGKKAEDATYLKTIRSVIATLGKTPAEAMELLSVPVAARPRYLALLGATST